MKRTQASWAKAANVVPSAVYKWLTGENKISIEKAKRLAELTGKPWHEICELSPQALADLLGVKSPAGKSGD